MHITLKFTNYDKTKINSGHCFFSITTIASAQTADDRSLFDVTGNVKSITSKSDTGPLSLIIECSSVIFSKAGTMTKINGMTPTSHGTKVTSRTNGLPSKVRLTYCDEAGEMPYTVAIRHNGKHKILKASSSDYPIEKFSTSFSYDPTGRLKSVECSGSVEGRMLTYKYISFDAKGNWTKRTVSIRYFSIDANGKKVFISGIEEETEARTITYY